MRLQKQRIMPFIEITGSDHNEDQRRRLGQRLTEGLVDAFSIEPGIVTIYFQPVPPSAYVHAGQLAPPGAMRQFLKVHAFPRALPLKRRAARLLPQPRHAVHVDLTDGEHHVARGPAPRMGHRRFGSRSPSRSPP